ncbi:MAG: carboxypeptidase regulatory-like domain-containing protein [bacterium]|nr:carboxypeptidase regulatory-like domain-containing protein [bacterium]
MHLLAALITTVAVAAPVRVSVTGAGAFPELTETLSVTLVATPHSTARTAEPNDLAFQLPAPGNKTIDLEVGWWQLSLDAKGFWGADRDLEVEDQENHVHFDLWPTGALQARLLAPKNQRIPEVIVVHFEPAPGRRRSADGPQGTVSCPASGERWRCPLPAGLLDLRLAAESYVSRYRWGVEVHPGQPLDLGTLPFQHGSSVSGWVEIAGGEAAGGAQVALTPQSVSRHPQRSGEKGRLGLMNLTAATNARGFFQIDRVAPGSYVIEAAKDSYAPARATVRALEGEETLIARPPLVLHPLQTVEVYVQPPVPPEAEQWLLEVVQLDRRSHTIQSFDKTTISPSGTWSSTVVPPGRYRFILRTAADGGPWLSQDEEIEPDPLPVFLDLPIIEVRGTVLFGGEPLIAEVRFGGEFGAASIPLDTDEDGRFAGYLPHPGDWEVDVIGVDRAVHTNIRGVEIRKRPGKTYAEVLLEIPDTKIEVTVVSESGSPLGGASVTARSHAEKISPIREATDPEGKLEIFGLPPGLLTLTAEARVNRQYILSEEVLVDLEEGGEPEKARLVLKPEMVVHGRVVFGDRGVPGAQIKAIPALARGRLIPLETTDATGSFTIRLPSETTRYFLSIAPPGFAFQFTSLPVVPAEPVVIPVSEEGGTLMVSLHRPGSPDGDGISRALVYHNGGRERLPFLLYWARFNEQPQTDAGTITIPRMSAGDYTVCISQEGKALPLRQSPESEDVCAGGFLPAGGFLRLSLDESE